MDDRTTRLLEALDPVGVSLLLELLRGPSTESQLLDGAEATQSTVNRRLDRLSRAQLIANEPGKPRAPGRLWTAVHPAESEVLLTALFALADAIDARERAERDRAKRRLTEARAELGIRRVRQQRENE